MNNILTRSGKISVIFACVLLLVVSASAQNSLRKAIDYDQDGKADFSVFRPENNYWYVRGSSGSFIFQQFGSSNTDYQVPGDYDGDGKGDICVWRDTDGIWYRLSSQTGTFSATPFGATGDEPIARDYDGDGKSDLAVIRRSNGVMTWYILNSQNGAISGTQFGASGTDYSAPGDYDGDGKFDLAVQRAGANPTDQGVFFILNSQSGAISSIPWGYSNDLVVPGDYDGDGKTDVAVVREGASANTGLSWFIRLSGSNGAQRSVVFGATGSDLNAQNDYDGDGKCDIAVWRDTNGNFYVLNSQSGAVTATPWGVANDFPVASFDTH